MRRSGAWALAAAALLPLVVFAPVLFGDQALVARDVLHHYWPLQDLVARLWAQGELPQWNPHENAGLPLLGNVHAAVLYPPNRVAYALLSFPRAYAWLLAFHLGVLGAGMVVLARRWTGAWPALCAAGVVQLSGYAMSLHAYQPMLAGLAWTPWVAAVLLGPWPWKKRLAVAAPLLGLQALSGDPMSALMSGLMVGVLAFEWPRVARRLGLAAAAAGVGALLAGVQLAPAWVALGQSTRAAGKVTEQLMWSMPPVRLLEWVLPNVFGHYLGAPGFWGVWFANGPVNIPFSVSLYLGAAALGLAVLGVARRREVALAGALVGLGLVLSLGSALPPVAWVLTHVPPLTFFRYPEKYHWLCAVGVGLLAALGAEAVGRGSVRLWRLAPLAAVGLTGLLWARGFRGAAVQQASAFLSARSVRLPGDWVVDAVGQASATSVLFLAALALVAWLARRRPDARWPVLLAAMIVVDAAAANVEHLWTAPRELYSLKPPLADELAKLVPPGPFRYWRDATWMDRRAPASGSVAGMVERRAWDVQTLKSSLGGLWGLDELSGSSAVELARWRTIAVRLGRRRALLHPLFNVCLAIAPTDAGVIAADGRFRPLLHFDRNTAVLSDGECVPRLRGVERLVGVGDVDAAFAALVSPGFDVRSTATIEGAPSEDGLGPIEVREQHFGAQEVWAQLKAGGRGGLLVVGSVWYPGWRATVDGAPAPVEIIDGALMGVRVPAGLHHLELRFQEVGWLPGLAMSAVGLLLWLSLVVLHAADARRHQR